MSYELWLLIPKKWLKMDNYVISVSSKQAHSSVSSVGQKKGQMNERLRHALKSFKTASTWLQDLIRQSVGLSVIFWARLCIWKNSQELLPAFSLRLHQNSLHITDPDPGPYTNSWFSAKRTFFTGLNSCISLASSSNLPLVWRNWSGLSSPTSPLKFYVF